MKYRKKPVIIEAVLFNPSVFDDAWVGDNHFREHIPTGVKEDMTVETGYSIKTLEGKHEVTLGDWIITGVKGEKYPCKPDIFEMTYEKVEE